VNSPIMAKMRNAAKKRQGHFFPKTNPMALLYAEQKIYAIGFLKDRIDTSFFSVIQSV
jgi:hypothetical protein